MSVNSSDVSAGQDVYQTDINNLRKDLFLGNRISEDVAGAAIVTLDLSNVANGCIKNIDLDQNITLRFSGITKYPTVFFVRFKQDAGGGNTVDIDQNGVRYPGKAEPVISSGANEVTGLMFICWGVNDFDCYYAGFGLGEPS